MNKILHTINKAFNITTYEWGRVLFSFSLKTTIFGVYVIASTLLVASFLENYGILNLPVLYIILAASTIAGSIGLGFFLESKNKKRVLIWLSVFAVFFISVTGISEERSFLFFGSLVFFVSVIITQIKIVLGIFIEELFSPLESERTIPFVEAAEPVGGILAGTLLALGVSHIEITGFFKIVIFLLIFFMFLSSLAILLDKTPRLKHKEKVVKKESKVEKIYKGFKQIKGTKFLRYISIIVFLQFLIFTLIEYQYTSALDKSIQENSVVYSEDGDSEYDKESYTSKLAQGLGFYHVVFSILLFLSQVFVSGRLNKKFGLIKTMSLNPMLMLIPTFGLLSFFGVKTAVLTKASFEVLNGLHRTAYFTLFYATDEKMKEYGKEFNEGIALPLGKAAGTIILLLLGYFLSGDILHFVISGIIFGAFILMYILIKNMKDKYTQTAKKKAETSHNIEERLEAIEVLTQKGHKRANLILTNLLMKKNSDEIKGKILYSLGKIGNNESIPEILDLIQHEDKEIQKAALNALLNFKINGKNLFEDGFTKFRLLEELKKLFQTTKSKTIKELIIKNFANIHSEEIIPFIIETLENSDDEIRKNIIYICKNFNDINLAHYIEKFLKSENPKVKASVIISLWQFEQMRLKLTIQISKLLLSKNKDEKLAAIFILGEIQTKQEIGKLYKFLEDEDEEIRESAIISILKLGEIGFSHHIIEYLLHENKENAIRTKKMLSSIPENILKHINNLVKHEVIIKIKKIIKKERTQFLEKMPRETLEDLIHLYYIIDEHDEVIKIKHILNEKIGIEK